MTTTFNNTEQEVLVLQSVWQSIDEMVNYGMLIKLSRTNDAELRFETAMHQRLFNILLVDFLSQPSKWPFGLSSPPTGAPKSERSILFHLKRICDDPKLNPTGSNSLKIPLDAFEQWLEAECCVEKVWLPSIDLETDIRVKRIAFIKICGNIAKHNFVRLGANVVEIEEILKANGTTIDRDQGYLVIPEFYEWFHANVFTYHSSAIAEFLNNIRWGIYDYLKMEYGRSFTKDDPNDPIKYRFIYPSDCHHPIAKTMYWDLMNAMRSEPCMPRFNVTRFLKMHF
jgi:hypothetical protein